MAKGPEITRNEGKGGSQESLSHGQRAENTGGSVYNRVVGNYKKGAEEPSFDELLDRR